MLLVAELATSGFSVEGPVDFDSIAVHAAVPGATLTPQSFQIGDPPGAEALAGEQTNFDFRLIEPASVRGRVMHREAIPDLTAELYPIEICEGVAAVDIQVIHHQVNGFRLASLPGSAGEGGRTSACSVIGSRPGTPLVHWHRRVVRTSPRHLPSFDVAFIEFGYRPHFAESARGIAPRAAHRTVRKPLDLHGSYDREKAAAFRLA